jgi:cytochrome c biogenesis protein CcmG/thiol:disulfide interchange protein DsbE
VSRVLAALPLVGLAALALLFATFGLHHDPHVTPAALVGKPVPAARLPTLDGGAPTPLQADLQGPTLINFFASWCAPCAEENPALLALRSQGVRIVGVSYKDDPGASRAFLQKLGNPFAAIRVDRDGRAGIDFGVSGVPETFLVATDGRILAKHAGPLQPADAEALLAQAQGASRPADR